MGYYINPKEDTKEEWLGEHAEPISVDTALAWDNFAVRMPVCLVDNGAFTAAGVAYCKDEVQAFAHPDPRPKQWWSASRFDLEAVIGGTLPKHSVRG